MTLRWWLLYLTLLISLSGQVVLINKNSRLMTANRNLVDADAKLQATYKELKTNYEALTADPNALVCFCTFHKNSKGQWMMRIHYNGIVVQDAPIYQGDK